MTPLEHAHCTPWRRCGPGKPKTRRRMEIVSCRRRRCRQSAPTLGCYDDLRALRHRSALQPPHHVRLKVRNFNAEAQRRREGEKFCSLSRSSANLCTLRQLVLLPTASALSRNSHKAAAKTTRKRHIFTFRASFGLRRYNHKDCFESPHKAAMNTRSAIFTFVPCACAHRQKSKFSMPTHPFRPRTADSCLKWERPPINFARNLKFSRCHATPDRCARCICMASQPASASGAAAPVGRAIKSVTRYPECPQPQRVRAQHGAIVCGAGGVQRGRGLEIEGKRAGVPAPRPPSESVLTLLPRRHPPPSGGDGSNDLASAAVCIEPHALQQNRGGRRRILPRRSSVTVKSGSASRVQRYPHRPSGR